MERSEKKRLLKAFVESAEDMTGIACGGGFIFYIRLLEIMGGVDKFSDAFDVYDGDEVDSYAMEHMADMSVAPEVRFAGEKFLFEIAEDSAEISVPPDGYSEEGETNHIYDEVASVMDIDGAELKKRVWNNYPDRGSYIEFLNHELYPALEEVYPERYDFLNTISVDERIEFAEWWCACQENVNEEDWSLSMNNIVSITSTAVDDWLYYIHENEIEEEDRMRGCEIIYDVVDRFRREFLCQLEGITYASIKGKQVYHDGVKDMKFQLVCHSAWQLATYAYVSYDCCAMGLIAPRLLIAFISATEFLEEMEVKYHFRRECPDGE